MLVQMLKTALPVFAALFIGVLCRKKEILTREGVDSVKKVAVNITLPAVLFPAFATADYAARNLLIPVSVFCACLLALFLGKIGAKLTRMRGSLAPFLMTGFEAGMLGYGLFGFLYPEELLPRFALIDLGQCMFVFSVYKILLNGRGGAKNAVRDALNSPVMWSMVLGVIFGATGLWNALIPSGAADIVLNTADFLSAPTSCLILIAVGYDLSLREIRFGRVLGYVGMRLIVMAVIFAALTLLDRYAFGGIIHTGGLVLMLILPAPFVLPIFANAGDERGDVASALSLMTLLTLAVFTAMAAFV